MSIERSHIGPRQVRPMDFTDVANFKDLARVGIIIDESKLAQMASGMDSLQAGVTTASIPTFVQFLQNWLPGFVRVSTAARKIDELVGITNSGSPEDEEIVQQMIETLGDAVEYGDYTNVPLSSWNTVAERRTIRRFEQGIRVGVLEEERAAKINVNSAQWKREAANMALEIQRNRVGFYGFNNGDGRTYGFLNDPSLPAYVTVATGAAASPLWANKTFLEICKDIRTCLVALRTQSKEVVNPDSTPITLAIATACVDRLSTTSDFGISVRDWLSKAYPNVRVVSAPELDAANGSANVMYAYAETVDDSSTDGGRTWVQVVPAKFQVIGVQKLAKGYEEDYRNATAGVMLKRPFAVYRASGI